MSLINRSNSFGVIGIWLGDYTTHVPLIGYVYSPDDYDPHHLTLSEWKTLMCSLLSGARASRK